VVDEIRIWPFEIENTSHQPTIVNLVVYTGFGSAVDLIVPDRIALVNR